MVQLGLAAEAVVVRCCRLPSRLDVGPFLAREGTPGSRQSLNSSQQGPACRPACLETGWSRSALLLQGCDPAFQLYGLNCLALRLQDGGDRLSLVWGDFARANGISHRTYRSHNVGSRLDGRELQCHRT